MKIDIKQSVMNGAAAMDKGKFAYDRKAWGNASELFGCIRKQWYQKNTPEAGAPENWGFARRGNHGEKYLVEKMIAANMPLMGAGDEQATLQDEDRRVSCTPDGHLAYDDGCVSVEFKTIDPRKNRGKLPTEQHVKQLQIAMEMQSDRGLKIVSGLLVYMDASNFDDIIQFEVQRNHSIMVAAGHRAKKKLTTRNVDMLDREGKASGECSYCAFTETCGVKKLEVGRDPVKSNRGSKLSDNVIAFTDLKKQAEETKASMDALKEFIKQELLKRKTHKTEVGDFVVELQFVKGRTSLDKKAVKAAGINLSPFEKVGNASERLTVTKKEV